MPKPTLTSEGHHVTRKWRHEDTCGVGGSGIEWGYMPGFHHSVAVLLIRSCRCRCAWCWKRLSLYIGMKWPERWLVARLRQNGKNRIRSYCYGTAVTAQRQVETATALFNIIRRLRFELFDTAPRPPPAKCFWHFDILKFAWSLQVKALKALTADHRGSCQP